MHSGEVNLLFNVTINEVNWLLNVRINDISVIYVTAHGCAGGLKKLDLLSDSQCHRHFAGFPSKHRHGIPREDARGLSREYVLRIPSMS